MRISNKKDFMCLNMKFKFVFVRKGNFRVSTYKGFRHVLKISSEIWSLLRFIHGVREGRFLVSDIKGPSEIAFPFFFFFPLHMIRKPHTRIYRVSRGECATLRENVPYVKVHRYNTDHLYPKLNGYGVNGERSLKVWQLLHTIWLPNTY